jgi:hypothetical protein
MVQRYKIINIAKMFKNGWWIKDEILKILWW